MSKDHGGARLAVESAVNRAATAAHILRRRQGEWRAPVLESIADGLEGARAEILSTVAAETALTEQELTPEFARMTGTLRMFAALVREGSWVRAAIDPAGADGAGSAGVIGPNYDVRRMFVPLDGVVAVFGASNFPLAYGVCGGDTASALAAGCGVVVKEHPAHPLTGRLIAEMAQRAIESSGFPPELLGYALHTDPGEHSTAHRILAHPSVAAVGFTGSVGGGRAIERLARERKEPIPVFAEMGSVNPVVITTAAAERRGPEIADHLAGSILARFGQQCTCPGMIVVPPVEPGDVIVRRLSERIAAARGREMLAPWIRDTYLRRLDEVARSRGVRVLACGNSAPGPRGAGACLFSVDELYPPDAPGLCVLEQDEVRDEIFGPAAVVVRRFGDDLFELGVRGSLTYSVFAEPGEDPSNELLDFGRGACSWAARSAGRIVFNGLPTGVRVAHGMVHGGPWPSTNRPDTTAVGPYAIERWCRPVCFQNCPDELLPPELRDANPRGILRVVNGVATRGAVTRGG